VVPGARRYLTTAGSFPTSALPDHDGIVWTLSELAAGDPLILRFYRWCSAPRRGPGAPSCSRSPSPRRSPTPRSCAVTADPCWLALLSGMSGRSGRADPVDRAHGAADASDLDGRRVGVLAGAGVIGVRVSVVGPARNAAPGHPGPPAGDYVLSLVTLCCQRGRRSGADRRTVVSTDLRGRARERRDVGGVPHLRSVRGGVVRATGVLVLWARRTAPGDAGGRGRADAEPGDMAWLGRRLTRRAATEHATEHGNDQVTSRSPQPPKVHLIHAWARLRERSGDIAVAAAAESPPDRRTAPARRLTSRHSYRHKSDLFVISAPQALSRRQSRCTVCDDFADARRSARPAILRAPAAGPGSIDSRTGRLRLRPSVQSAPEGLRV